MRATHKPRVLEGGALPETPRRLLKKPAPFGRPPATAATYVLYHVNGSLSMNLKSYAARPGAVATVGLNSRLLPMALPYHTI